MTRKPKYKPHHTLGLSYQEYGALLGTRAMIVAGALQYTKDVTTVRGAKHMINMGVACTTNGECGSVACIGGTMAQIMGKGPYEAKSYVENQRGELKALFYPPSDYTYKYIKADEMLKAIDNYLTKGKAMWAKVLGSVTKFDLRR